jgi:hypothetical protein
MTFRKQEDAEVGGNAGSHFLENSVWKRLWTIRKTDYYLNLNHRYVRCVRDTQKCIENVNLKTETINI